MEARIQSTNPSPSSCQFESQRVRFARPKRKLKQNNLNHNVNESYFKVSPPSTATIVQAEMMIHRTTWVILVVAAGMVEKKSGKVTQTPILDSPQPEGKRMYA